MMYNVNYLRICFLLLAVCSVSSSYGQDILDRYIRDGLRDNLTIRDKGVDFQKAINALDVAKSMYLPSLVFDATYTNARGGRVTQLPIGDMLNPVYTTLNQLTQSNSFPQLENETINFLPRNYYDIRLRTTMPIFNRDIQHNRQIKARMVDLQEVDLSIFKRELVKDIKQAYYNYLSAHDAVKVYQNSLELAKEGKRVNEKLLDAGSGLPAYLVRADAEIAQVEAELSSAEQNRLSAQYYFNFLLNREANMPIDMEEVLDQHFVERNLLGTDSISGREELEALRGEMDINEELVAMHKEVFLPKLNAFLDLGGQAEDMQFNKRAPYYIVGAQLSLPIFEGNRNRLKIKESQLAVAASRNKLETVSKQLDLSLRIAKNEMNAAWKNFLAAKEQVAAAATYQRLIQRGFNEGVNTYIETVDARAQLTSAKLAENIASYTWLSSVAQLERENASYPMPDEVTMKK